MSIVPRLKSPGIDDKKNVGKYFSVFRARNDYVTYGKQVFFTVCVLKAKTVPTLCIPGNSTGKQ